MSDLFKSAIGYFSSSNASGAENEFIGQTVEVGNVKLRVKKIIAEGRVEVNMILTSLIFISIVLY
jgi:cyclin G-associated kinase